MRTLIIVSFCFVTVGLCAQESTLSINEAIEQSLKNNATIKAAAYHVEAQRQLQNTSFDLPKTEVSLLYGQYNSYAKDNNVTVMQSIPFFVLGSQARLNRSLVTSSELQKAVTENDLVYQVKQTYYQLAYVYSLKNLLLEQDSIFEGFYRAASSRYKAGETNLLEQSTAEAQRNESKNRIRETDADIAVLKSQLSTLLNATHEVNITEKHLSEISTTVILDSTVLKENPLLAFSRQQVAIATAERKLQAARSAPDLLIGYFNQTLTGTPDLKTGALASTSQRFSGFQVGLAIPLWFGPYQGRMRAAEYNKRAAESEFTAQQRTLDAQFQQAYQSYEKTKSSLAYYKETGLPNATLILRQSQIAFRNGEIGYAEYLLGLRNAISIRERYLQTLGNYNQSIIFLEFISGNKNN